LSALVYKALDFSSVHSRLAVVMAAAGSFPAAKGNERMPGEIRINGDEILCVNDAISMIKSMSRGRLTITGGNGSGKSTMLLALKDQFMTEGFLLPADHHRLVWRSNLAHLSSGQRAQSSILELLELKDIKVIFLDEWDANLDADNMKFMDALLERSAQDKVIVEVRH
jgi:ABC-type Mn2+/Zn2+ transport system ATPase subunit